MLFLFSLAIFYLFIFHTPCSIRFTLSLGEVLVLSADSYSYIFMLTLLSVSVSVLCWSYYYLDTETVYRRFFSIVLAFLLSMFLLVFSADIMALFVA